jgi:hypothetical protein
MLHQLQELRPSGNPFAVASSSPVPAADAHLDSEFSRAQFVKLFQIALRSLI